MQHNCQKASILYILHTNLSFYNMIVEIYSHTLQIGCSASKGGIEVEYYHQPQTNYLEVLQNCHYCTNESIHKLKANSYSNKIKYILKNRRVIGIITITYLKL